MIAPLLLASSATLHVALYDDYDVGGPHPASTSSVDALEFEVDVAGSAEVTGTVTLGASPYYAFNCTYGGGQLVFVWLADHLICHTDPPFPMIGQGFSSHDGSPSYPLRGGGRALPLVIHVYAASADGSGRVTSSARARAELVTRPEPSALAAYTWITSGSARPPPRSGYDGLPSWEEKPCPIIGNGGSVWQIR